MVTPPPGPCVQPRRNPPRGYPGGQQQAGQRIGRVDRPLPGRVSVQRQEKLPVREHPGQPVRGVHREGGLADPGHPIDRDDPHHPATRRRGGGQRPHQLGEFGLPARERGDVARQGPGRRCRERPQRLVLPGREHLGWGGLAAGRGHEQLPHRPRQAQRTSQQNAGVLVGSAGDPPLQVTDRTRAQARRRCQLLLRQLGLSAQLLQQPGKTHLRLGHRPSVPSQPPRRLTRREMACTNSTLGQPA